MLELKNYQWLFQNILSQRRKRQGKAQVPGKTTVISFRSSSWSCCVNAIALLFSVFHGFGKQFCPETTLRKLIAFVLASQAIIL
jgi:hypothetical protein